MKKRTFEEKWYIKLLKVIYFGSLIAFSLFLIMAGIHGSDVEFAGFFWAGVLCFVYWLIKRIFYWLVLEEKVFENNGYGVLIGFCFGVVVAFTWIFIMSKIYPDEDFAGIVIVSSLVSGLIFGFFGYLVQNYFRRKSKK